MSWKRRLEAAAVLFSVATLAGPAGASPPEGCHYFDPVLSEGVFTLYAALNLHGHDNVGNFLGMYPLRTRVRERLGEKEGLHEQAHRIGHAAHELGHVGGIVAVVKFVLLTEGPPDFKIGDVSSYSGETRRLIDEGRAMGLGNALSGFHRDADIASLWGEVRPEYERVAGTYVGAADSAAAEALSFLGIENGALASRRVTVLPNLLTTYWSGFRFDVDGRPFVAFGPYVDADPSVAVRALLEQIFRAAVADNYVLVRERRSLFELVEEHPRIRSCCRRFHELVTECVVWTVWAHASGGEHRWVEGEIDRLYAQGYILVKAFNEQIQRGAGGAPRDLVERWVGSVRVPREGARWVKSEPERARWLAISQADLDRRQGRMSEARMAYDEILATEPENARALYGLGSLHYDQEHYGQARETLRRAIEAEPDEDWVKTWSWLRIGWIEDLTGNREAAIEAYRRAIDSGSGYRNAREIARRGIEKPFQQP